MLPFVCIKYINHISWIKFKIKLSLPIGPTKMLVNRKKRKHYLTKSIRGTLIHFRNDVVDNIFTALQCAFSIAAA